MTPEFWSYGAELWVLGAPEQAAKHRTSGAASWSSEDLDFFTRVAENEAFGKLDLRGTLLERVQHCFLKIGLKKVVVNGY